MSRWRSRLVSCLLALPLLAWLVPPSSSLAQSSAFDSSNGQLPVPTPINAPSVALPMPSAGEVPVGTPPWPLANGPCPTDAAMPNVPPRGANPSALPGTSAAPLSSMSGIGMGLGGPGGAAVGGAGLAFNPIVGQLPIVGSYRAADYFNAPVLNQNAHLGYAQQELSLLTPIWQCSTDEISATAHVGVESFNTNAVLLDSQQSFPSELWNIALGGNYRHRFDNGWIGGGGLSVGSQSDRPFDNLNVMSVTADGFFRVPEGEHDAWIFSVFLSSNSQVLPFIPIPGIAYFYAPSRSFQALIGFPFAHLNWNPTEDWSVFVSYALLTKFRTRVSYRLARQVRLYTAFDFDNQNYYLANRPNPDDRFFSYYDRLSSGVMVFLGRGAFFDLSGGYVFNRRYFETPGGFQNHAAFDRVNVAPGAFVAASLQFRF